MQKTIDEFEDWKEIAFVKGEDGGQRDASIYHFFFALNNSISRMIKQRKQHAR